MPSEEIHNWLIIDWQNGSTRTRKSEPDPSSLGTHEIATEVHLDLVIPEVDVDNLTARVEVPQPRVEATELEDLATAVAERSYNRSAAKDNEDRTERLYLSYQPHEVPIFIDGVTAQQTLLAATDGGNDQPVGAGTGRNRGEE